MNIRYPIYEGVYRILTNYSPLNFIRMNIGLVDVDGHNFPNFALMRLSAYNKAKGCQVE